MREISSLKEVNEIIGREYSTITRILTYYNLKADSISRIEGAYLIDTQEGRFILKKVKHGRKSITKSCKLTEYFINSGFLNLLEIFRTTEGKPYAKGRHTYYYLSQYIDGRKCNTDDINEIKECTHLLGIFHSIASEIGRKKHIKINTGLKDWPSVMKKQCIDLLKYKDIIEKKRIRSEFDIIYNSYIDYFYRIGNAASNLFSVSNYLLLSTKSKNEHSICHGSFNYKNLVVDGKGIIYILSLENALSDIRVCELGKFIKKTLSQCNHMWNFETASCMIDLYDSILQISKEEMEALLAILINPKEFCKLGEKRYLKNKPISEQNYMSRLKKITVEIGLQQEFIKQYIKKYKIDLNLDELLTEQKEGTTA